MLKILMEGVNFKEHPVVDPITEDVSEFDIISLDNKESFTHTIKGEFNMEYYCLCLFNKLIRSPKKIYGFIHYQCSLMDDPSAWLYQIMDLLDQNMEKMESLKDKKKIVRIMLVILEKLYDLEKRAFELGRFDFDKIKRKLRAFNTAEEKLFYLLEVKADYLQNKPVIIPVGRMPFDEKVNLQMELIRDQSALNIDQSMHSESASGLTKKIKINCNLNVFVDAFYQWMYEYQVEGKPVLEAHPGNVAGFISQCFLDKTGKEISPETVKVILKPSRVEKRPKGRARISVACSGFKPVRP